MKFIVNLLSLMLLGCSPIFAQIPGYVPTNGLKGYWPFSGNANDQTINGNNGIVTGAILANDRFGNSNSSYSFNGISDYILTPYLGVLGNNSRALSFWAKTQSLAEMIGVSWGGDSQAGRFNGMFNYSVNGITIDFAYGAITYASPSNSYDGIWHHYVFQFNNPTLDQVEVYQDGVLLTQTLHVYNGTLTANTTTGHNVTFGKIYLQGRELFFEGQLDDIGIWDRTLTSCEIQSLFTSSIPTITISVSNNTICEGQNSNINASGATNLLWSNSVSGPSISVSPSVTTNYTVVGINSNSCTVSGTTTIMVLKCTGLNESELESSFQIYPNPAQDKLFLALNQSYCKIEILSINGAVVRSCSAESKAIDIDLSDLENGLFFVKVSSEKGSFVKKLIIVK